MKTRTHVLFAILSLSLGASSPVYGHHPVFSIYDLSQTVVIQGRVVQFSLRNPHSFFSIEVISKDGSKANWGAEWGKTNELTPIGVASSTFKVGDVVSIIGSPTIAGDHVLLVRSVSRASDGMRWNLQTH